MKHPTAVQDPTMPGKSNAQKNRPAANLTSLVWSCEAQMKALATSLNVLSVHSGVAASPCFRLCEARVAESFSTSFSCFFSAAFFYFICLFLSRI